MEDKYRDTPRGMNRLSNLRDFEVADDSPDIRGWDVATIDARTIGRVDDLIVDTEEMKARYLVVDVASPEHSGVAHEHDDERHVLVPLDRAHVDEAEQVVRLDVAGASAESMPAFTGSVPADYDERYRRDMPIAEGARGGSQRITRAAEELKIGRRTVPAGEVKVTKHIETEHVREPVQRTREDVHVERRPVAGARSRGELKEEEVRVPITEEEVVVEKRPVVKEELVITKEAKSEQADVEADIRKERVDVERTGKARTDRGRTR